MNDLYTASDRRMSVPDPAWDGPAARHARAIILGAGPAGFTAAIYAARAGLRPLLLTGLQPGGQLTTTTEVENYPGFAASVQGSWLMEQMAAQATHVGAETVMDTIVSVDLSRMPFQLSGENGTYTCDGLIIATGAKARWLGVPGEAEYAGRGVSACATCDGFFFRGRDVAVVGGGNTAVEEALYLANLARKVTLIHRRAELRCERILEDRLRAAANVDILWNMVVDRMVGEHLGHAPSLTGLMLRDTVDGASRSLAVEGAFIAIGHDPATGLFRGQLPMDDDGYVTTGPDSTRTGIQGVFAAGDVQDKVFRQAVTAAGTGCMAALELERWLSGKAPGQPMAAAY